VYWPWPPSLSPFSFQVGIASDARGPANSICSTVGGTVALLHAGGIDFGWASVGSAINWPAESGGRE